MKHTDKKYWEILILLNNYILNETLFQEREFGVYLFYYNHRFNYILVHHNSTEKEISDTDNSADTCRTHNTAK